MRVLPLVLLCGALAACSDDDPTAPDPGSVRVQAPRVSFAVGEEMQLSVRAFDAAGRAVDGVSVTWSSSDTTVASVSPSGVLRARFPGRATVRATRVGTAVADSVQVAVAPLSLPALGLGEVAERYTAEVAVRGPWAYTTSWGNRSAPGNAIKIWDVTGTVPVLVDSVIVTDGSPTTLGDVQVTDDGRLLVVATERAPGAIVIFDLADPVRPRQIARHGTASTQPGVHTAEVARVNGRLHAFLSIDPPNARLVVVDLADPARPREVLVKPMGNPFQHDVFVRDGLLFTASWDDGLTIYDVGGAHGGSVENPLQLGTVRTVGGATHNVWWAHDSVTGEKRYAFVGEENDFDFFTRTSGDVHVVDVSDLRNPREVAFYHVPGAGTHNFSVNERLGVLYAAFYNGGVRAIDIRGALGACLPAERSGDGRCDLGRMGREVAQGLTSAGRQVYVWGVQQDGGFLYASDMLNGLWKLDARTLAR